MKTIHGNPITLFGKELKVGDKAPNFSVINSSLKPITLDDFHKEYILLSVVPSLDTSVCDFQTKKINEELATFKNVDFVTISMDLPFAQGRWCGSAGLEITTLSDHKEADFGKKYGTLINELRLLARAVFLINKKREVIYVEYLDEMTNHPDYDKLLKCLNAL